MTNTPQIPVQEDLRIFEPGDWVEVIERYLCPLTYGHVYQIESIKEGCAKFKQYKGAVHNLKHLKKVDFIPKERPEDEDSR